jgi:hypothetical protein
MLYTFSKNWSLYTGISFLSCVATALPITRFGIGLLILGYTLYGAVNTFITFSKIEQSGNAHDRQAMRWAIAFNAPDFLYLAVAVIAGIYLGVAH